ncbi:hypothetical protein P8452_51012 [Trifolium repens]|nr:hypothetical protein P8452_51012 [Trifolium repens]
MREKVGFVNQAQTKAYKTDFYHHHRCPPSGATSHCAFILAAPPKNHHGFSSPSEIASERLSTLELSVAV